MPEPIPHKEHTSKQTVVHRAVLGRNTTIPTRPSVPLPDLGICIEPRPHRGGRGDLYPLLLEGLSVLCNRKSLVTVPAVTMRAVVIVMSMAVMMAVVIMMLSVVVIVTALMRGGGMTVSVIRMARRRSATAKKVTSS